MRIEIDTKKDSTDDIKKTIDFLLKFVEQSSVEKSELPTVGEGTFNIFDNPQSDEEDKENDDIPSVSIVEY